MRLLVRGPVGEAMVDVLVHDPCATVGALLTEVLGSWQEPVHLDGTAVPSTRALGECALAEGSTLDATGRRAPAPPAGRWALVVLAGPGSGATHLVPAAGGTLGRAPDSAVVLAGRTVSRRHAGLRVVPDGVEVRALPAANSTVVDGDALEPDTTAVLRAGSTLRVGTVLLALRPHQPPQPWPAAGTDGRVAVSRPPAPHPGPPRPVPPVPEPPRDPEPTPFAWSGVLGGLVVAGAAVALTGDPRYAALSALMPVLAVGTWLEARVRARRTARRAARSHRAALRSLHAALDAAARDERRRRHRLTPDLAALRARLPGTALWERGADAPVEVTVGRGDLRWQADGKDPALERLLTDVPLTMPLAPGTVTGVVGDPAAARAVARALVLQTCLQHGPAHLELGVAADPDREADWRWACWLPQLRLAQAPEQQRAACGAAETRALLRALPAGLLVLDGPAVTSVLPADAAVACLVVAASRADLPGRCGTVLEVDPDGRLRVLTADGEQGGTALLLDLDAAAETARGLARCRDPEQQVRGGALPAQVALLPLLGLADPCPEGVRSRWAAAGADPGLRTPLGVGEHGPVALDLLRDGPHALVGGTTGAGKSELLRTMVAGLALAAGPQHLTFLLVDYKGGAAFDACAQLPHVVGLVTDLDPALAARALVSLEAELVHRERVLRAAGTADLGTYLAGDGEPLPRLVVVVDEFATLAADLPDFLPALIGVAQRGRTLGVHLVLATQRPSGVVSEDLRANTGLRVALRVQDRADSLDVLGVPDAALLHRSTPGRALLRAGPEEVLALQTAQVSVTREDRPALETVPVVLAPAPPPGPAAASGGRTDLDRLVDAACAAFVLTGDAPPRRPWAAPLPAELPLAQVAAVQGSQVQVARADAPQQQATFAAGWDLSAGPLLLLGAAGSGTSTALAALALTLAEHHPPSVLELMVLDLGAGDLRALQALPHVSVAVGGAEPGRLRAVLRGLVAEVERRRALPRDQARDRPTVVLLDGLGALRAELEDLEGLALLDALARVATDGTAVGLHLAISAERVAAVPPALAGAAAQRWLFRLVDAHEAGLAGWRGGVAPGGPPGRAVLLPSGLAAQVGRPGPGAAAATAARWTGHAPRPARFVPLPARVDPERLPPAQVAGEPWWLPVGLDEALAPAGLELWEGEHALVAGPARAGTSSTLLLLAGALERAGVQVVATGGPRSPLRALAGFTGDLDPAVLPDGPLALLVDDAHLHEDANGGLRALLERPRPGLRVLAGGRSEVLRTLYGHWTGVLRRSRTGLLLAPDPDLDGELLGATLPRRSDLAPRPGLARLVSGGSSVLVQLASPSSTACGRTAPDALPGPSVASTSRPPIR